MISRRGFTKLGLGGAVFAAGAKIITNAQGKANDFPERFVIIKKESKMNDSQTAMDDKTLFVKGKAQLEKADAERFAQNWKEANELIKQALAELGYRYMRENLRDDSGYKLVAADIQERGGKFNDAVLARRRILVDRLEHLRGKMIDNQPITDDKILLTKIKVLIEKTDVEIEIQNWKEANELLKQALAELGRRYAHPGTTIPDYSGRGLVLADQLEEEYNFGNAALERHNVLLERLKLLESKIQ